MFISTNILQQVVLWLRLSTLTISGFPIWWILAVPLSRLYLSKLLNHFKSQFPHVKNGNNKNIYFTACLGELRETIA